MSVAPASSEMPPQAGQGETAVLVTGGAGYIGSHVVLALLAEGREVIVLDDLSTGSRSLVDPRVKAFVKGNAGDRAVVTKLIETWRVGTILHFAGSIVVPDSVSQPLAYYRNNTANALALMETAAMAGIGSFIFSSTAAVYGNAGGTAPLTEQSPCAPESPYGHSKRMVEQALSDAETAKELRAISLRYFNVAGADPDGRTGQMGGDSTHLIRRAVEAATGQRPYLEIFGSDYDTPDGTAVRDFIHVADLAQAHLVALKHLEKGGPGGIFNCGYGRGFSVAQVIDRVQARSGKALDIRRAPRRKGDVASIIADATKLRRELGWQPAFDDLDTIIDHALAWQRKSAPGS